MTGQNMEESWHGVLTVTAHNGSGPNENHAG